MALIVHRIPFVLLASGSIVALFLTPIITIFLSLFIPAEQTFIHLFETILPRYTLNTALLLIGVVSCSLVVGVSTAWMVSNFNFFGRKIIAIFLLLPMAMPAYVAAFLYSDVLEYAGPVQTYLRAWLELERGEYWFPQMRSLGGAIFVLSIVLYPYVYLISKLAFEQSMPVIDIARTLKRGKIDAWLSAGIPYARPAIAASLLLVAMETLSDFGAVSILAVDTLTTAIYRTWYGYYNPVMAGKIAAWLLLFVFLLMGLEKHFRGKARYHFIRSGSEPYTLKELTPIYQFLLCVLCLVPITLGFILPVFLLIQNVLAHTELFDNVVQWFAFMARVTDYAKHSISLAMMVGMVAVIFAMIIGYQIKYSRSSWAVGLVRFCTLGYAVPGAVIAVGILVALAIVDRAGNVVLNFFGFETSQLWLSGSIAALVYACTFRFITVASQSLDAGFERVKPTLDDVAILAGYTPLQRLWKIHRPLLHHSLSLAFVMVAVDTLKELPATMIIRPFNFDTLATATYVMVSDERRVDASITALMIVVVAMIPVIIASRLLRAERR